MREILETATEEAEALLDNVYNRDIERWEWLKKQSLERMPKGKDLSDQVNAVLRQAAGETIRREVEPAAEKSFETVKGHPDLPQMPPQHVNLNEGLNVTKVLNKDIIEPRKNLLKKIKGLEDSISRSKKPREGTR